MFCCLADFFIFPIMFTVVQFWETQAANDAFRQWVPITLQGGGLFHVAMGAVLGVSAYGRTQEKLNGATTVSTGQPTQLPAGLPTPSLSSPVPNPTASGFSSPAPATGGFGGSSFGSAPAASGFSAPRPVAMSNPSFGGGFGGLDPSDPPVRNTRNDY